MTMRCRQILSSGIRIQQDLSAAVRAVFFQTDLEEFFYATDGGTLFIVNFRNRFYGLTCRHVLRTFTPGQIFITQEKRGVKGGLPAPVVGIAYPSSPTGAADGTDIIDVCAVQFADDLASDFFKGSAYIVDEKTVGTAQLGHELHVAGVLKEKSEIIPPDITMGFCHLILRDSGVSVSDPLLRQATATFARPEFSSVTGLSGSPVFDQTANVFCGMVCRGGMIGHSCTLYYIDVFDIMHFLSGVCEGTRHDIIQENHAG